MTIENEAAERAELREQLTAALALLSEADRAEMLARWAEDESRRDERMREVAFEELTIFLDQLSLKGRATTRPTI